jgi:hypothetical protein
MRPVGTPEQGSRQPMIVEAHLEFMNMRVDANCRTPALSPTVPCADVQSNTDQPIGSGNKIVTQLNSAENAARVG